MHRGALDDGKARASLGPFKMIGDQVVVDISTGKSRRMGGPHNAVRNFYRSYPDRRQHTLIHRHSRSEEHTSELQSLMRISYAVFCLKKKKTNTKNKLQRP